MKRENRKVHIGLVGLGLEAYWDQFDGLRQRLEQYIAVVERKTGSGCRKVVNLGLVDSSAKAVDAGHACRQQDIDFLLIYVTTYALSSTVLPIVLRAKVPVLLLNLQPAESIAYKTFNQMESRTAMTGEWLAYCSACPVPEITNVLTRLRIPFKQITGMLHEDPQCWDEIEQWLRGAEVVHALNHSRLGLIGHYYSGMLDIATDLALLSGRFGLHVEILEVDEISAICREVPEAKIAAKQFAFRKFFEIDHDCDDAELTRAALTSVALDNFVDRHGLDLLAYYYKGSGVPENENTMNSIILGMSMLTGAGVPVAGEYEVKNVVAMKIMDLLGCGGSFTEYYAMDFASDLILMGHDGPGHIGIAEGRIKVRSLQVYHGKVGSGLSVEMSVKHGPVTLLSVVEDAHKDFKFLVAEGESVPGEVLRIGNTNSRYKFSIGARKFVEEWNSAGPAHHCAVGIGHIADLISKVSYLLGLGFQQIC